MKNPDAPIGRKILPHDLPLFVNPADHIFFITICAASREGSTLLASASDLLASVRKSEEQGRWFARIFLVMPDHAHALLRFPSHGSMRETIRGWKRWTARFLGVKWQDGFFDHRLRSDESLDEKARYIWENPVRAGLVHQPEDWPHVHLGAAIDGSLGQRSLPG